MSLFAKLPDGLEVWRADNAQPTSKAAIKRHASPLKMALSASQQSGPAFNSYASAFSKSEFTNSIQKAAASCHKADAVT